MLCETSHLVFLKMTDQQITGKRSYRISTVEN